RLLLARLRGGEAAVRAVRDPVRHARPRGLRREHRRPVPVPVVGLLHGLPLPPGRRSSRDVRSGPDAALAAGATRLKSRLGRFWRLEEVGGPPLTSPNLHNLPRLSYLGSMSTAGPLRQPIPVARSILWSPAGEDGGGPATGPPPLSRLPGAVRVDGDPRARGGAGATGPGRSGLPVRRLVRVPGDERLLSGDRCRPATQPGDLRRPHPRRHHPAVGSRPGAARDTACPPDRLVPHAPAPPAQPHRARRRDARAILRRAVAGGLA